MINDYFFTAANSPAGASLQLVPNSEFTIPQFKILFTSPRSTTAHCPTGVRTPLAQAYRLCPIQNSKFRIHNSKCATPFGKLSEFVKVFSVINLFPPAGASL